MTTTTNAASTKTIKAVLIDLSGTLHIGDQPIPGAREALQRLRYSGRRVRFLTNTSAKSTAQLLEQLNGPQLQLNIQKDEIVTSVLATAAYVKKHQLKPLCLMEDVSDLPFEVQQLQPSKGQPAVSTASFDSVVVGLAPSQFHYQQLNAAFRILLQYPSNLIAIHRGNYVRDANDHELSLGPGAFVTALETASNCAVAKIMGKPSREFFASALWDDVAADEACMIGDDVSADINGALDVGMGIAILVQTGKYRKGDEEKAKINSKKDGKDDSSLVTNFQVCPSFVEAVDYILSTQ